MIESIVVWTIILVSAFFIGRKFWRQWKAAVDKKGIISCGCGCSCDGGSVCPPEADGNGRKQAAAGKPPIE